MQGKSNKYKTPVRQQSKNLKVATATKGINAHIPDWAVFAVIAFTAIIYIRALYNGFAVIDDDDYILNNPFIRDFSINGIRIIFSSFYLSNYHPLTTLSYLFEYICFGTIPLPYHLINVLLHLLNVWLIYKLAEKLSGKSLTAIIVAALFALHPMHVESVAWVSERKDVLYTLLYISSLLVYMRYLEKGFKAKYFAGALLLFIASLLSKSAAVTLPLILLTVDLYKGRKLTAKSLIEKVPFLLLSLVFGILAIVSQQATVSLNAVSQSYNLIDRIFLFTYTIAFYIVKAIVPFGLSAMHYFPTLHDGMLPWMCYTGLPAMMVIAWLIARRSTFRKELLFGFFFFLIALSVMIYVPMGNAYAAERYTYLPYTGLFYIAGQWISRKEKKQLQQLLLALISIIFIIFAYITWDRISVWKSGEAIFTDIIKKYPDNYYGYLERGRIESKKGELLKAKHDLDRSISLDSTIAEAYNLRGYEYFQSGDIRSAMSDYNHAVRLRPSWADAYSNRGNVFYGTGDMKSALLDYNKAIELKPDFATVYLNRGILKANTGDADGAMKDIDKSLSLSADAIAYSVRGNMKLIKKDYAGAIEDYNASLKLKADNDQVYYYRGNAYLNNKDTTAACNDWGKAVKLGNKNAGAMMKQNCK